MKNQKELKEEYMEIVATEVWPGNDHMIEYNRKSVAYIVELSNGDIIALEKPTIKKTFCFSYGFCGISSIEEEDAANRMARKAAEDINYFIEENMKQITKTIESLQNCIDSTKECYTFTRYMGQPDNSKLKGFSTCYLCNNPDYEPGFWSNCRDIKRLEEKDIKTIINGYEELAKSFEKRLNTYLKKYGLSKVNTWSFLSD